MNVTREQRESLIQLLRVCEGRGITLGYTTADDGVHIYVDGEDIYADFLNDGAQVSDALAEAIRGQG